MSSLEILSEGEGVFNYPSRYLKYFDIRNRKIIIIVADLQGCNSKKNNRQIVFFEFINYSVSTPHMAVVYKRKK
jgi:hypothetical protein